MYLFFRRDGVFLSSEGLSLHFGCHFSVLRKRCISLLSDLCLLRLMGLDNLGSVLVTCSRIPDGSDIECNIKLHEAVKLHPRAEHATMPTPSTLHCRRGG